MDDATFPFNDTFTHTAQIVATFLGVHVEPRALGDEAVTVTRPDGSLRSTSPNM